MLTDTLCVVFEQCGVRIMGALSASDSGNRYILTVQDEFSTFPMAVPIKEKTAKKVSKAYRMLF
jgi:hypothetical protein